MPNREYVGCRNGGYYVAGTRVSLASVVHQFRAGAAPEAILGCFPALGSLANVYGAIAFLLDHTELVEEYMAAQERLWAELRGCDEVA